MIGGVLVERVVKEVLPALTERKTQIEAMVSVSIHTQIGIILI